MDKVTKFAHVCIKCDRKWGHEGCVSDPTFVVYSDCWECDNTPWGSGAHAFEISSHSVVYPNDTFGTWAVWHYRKAHKSD